MARFAPQPRAPSTRFLRAGMEARGLGPISLISSSFVASRHPVSPRGGGSPWGPRFASLLTPGTEEKIWLPAPAVGKLITAYTLRAAIVLPMTPPALLAEAMRMGETPIWRAVILCRLPKNTLAEVSEPVLAVPSQPMSVPKQAKEPRASVSE